MSALPSDAAADPNEATRSRVLSYLASSISEEERLALAQKILKDHPDVVGVGATMASVLVGKIPRHKETISGFADRLNADADPDYEPPHDDTDAVLTHSTLKAVRAALGVSASGGSRASGGRGGRAGGAGGDDRGGRGRGQRKGGRRDANGNPVGGDGGGGDGGYADDSGGGYYDANGNYIDLGAAAEEADAVKDRLAELKRRQAAGELTDEELAELKRLEGKLAELEDVLSGGGDDSAEAGAIEDRLAELKRRQAAGELTDEELAELKRLESRLAELDTGDGTGGKRGKKGKKKGGNGVDDDDDDGEAEEARRRLAELKRKKKAGELSPEELAEQQRLDGKLKKLESSGGRGKKGGGYTNANGVKMVDVGCQAGETFQLPNRGKMGDDGGGDGAPTGGIQRGGKLPTSAVTSLCEIKFNRKDVNAMNTLMCRRMVAALYQVSCR